jgi:hypothetical protein
MTSHTVMYSGATESATNTSVEGTATVGLVAPGLTEAEFTAYYDNVVVTVAK